jgi:hypothetical protein
LEFTLTTGPVELRPTDEATAERATALGATYGLRFIPNHSSDFDKAMTEMDVAYPNELADP